MMDCRLVGGAGDIKLTKDGNTLLKEMVCSKTLTSNLALFLLFCFVGRDQERLHFYHVSPLDLRIGADGIVTEMYRPSFPLLTKKAGRGGGGWGCGGRGLVGWGDDGWSLFL